MWRMKELCFLNENEVEIGGGDRVRGKRGGKSWYADKDVFQTAVVRYVFNII